MQHVLRMEMAHERREGWRGGWCGGMVRGMGVLNEGGEGGGKESLFSEPEE